MLFRASKYGLFLLATRGAVCAIAQVGRAPVVERVTRVHNSTDSLAVRMNINVLEQEKGPMWDLLIRSLDALQNRAEDEEQSHFILAGIHGMPYAPYNGVQPVEGGSGGGYCPHDSPQLIPWHRAYLVLYEQALIDEAGRLALEYTNNSNAAAYQEASQKLRLPFWDWANDSTLPPSSTQETITVQGPMGDLVLHNPLHSYRWQTYPLNETQFPGQGDRGPTTTRNVNSAPHEMTNFVKDAVYRTFSSATTWDQIATTAWSGISFEAPHNAIHNYVGASFANLDLTAFDVLFWLHHCNVDRLAAMWTAAHGAGWQTRSFTSEGLFSTAKGEIITADSPLKPFYQADGKTFHTGKTVASIEDLGYTYPDIVAGDQGQNENIIIRINKLYSDLATAEKSNVIVASRRSWFVEIRVDREDLLLPCSIDVYLGEYLVGQTLLLDMPKTGYTHNEVSLLRAIRHLGIGDSQPEEIERTIMENLHIRVTKGDTILDPANIPSLRINLVGEDVTPPPNEMEFPLYGNRTTLAAIFGAASTALPSSSHAQFTPVVNDGCG